MNCDHVEYILEMHGLEGITDAEQRHIERCSHCRQLVRALSSLEDSLNALPVPPTRRVQVDEALVAAEANPVDVLTERRLEAARADWLGAIAKVEVVPARRRKFGVPRRRDADHLARVAFGMIAVAAFVVVGMVGAVVWHQSQSPLERTVDATTEAAAPAETPQPIDALGRP
ncbi:MAG: hypothetical protein AAFU77_00660 [Myxococcota bacterium]